MRTPAPVAGTPRRTWVALAASIALLAACAPGADGATRPVATASPVAAGASVPGQLAVSAVDTGISVSGVGIVSGVPDTLTVSIGVNVLRPTVNQAVSDAAVVAQQLIDALGAEGVEERDIQTANYNIRPRYDYRNDRQVLEGYEVDNTVSVKIQDVERAGDVIDAATAAGGDAVRVHGLRFALEDNAELLVAARAAAWQDALAKAQQLADLAGVTLGAPTRIAENVSTRPGPVDYERATSLDAGFSTPIVSGESDVTVSVTVTFGIDS